MSSTVVAGVTTVSTPQVQFLGQDVQVGGSDGTVAMLGATPVGQSATIATIANDANGTAIATAVNAIIAELIARGNIAAA